MFTSETFDGLVVSCSEVCPIHVDSANPWIGSVPSVDIEDSTKTEPVDTSDVIVGVTCFVDEMYVFLRNPDGTFGIPTF